MSRRLPVPSGAFLLAAASALTAHAALAQPATPPAPWPQADTVRELLRRETLAAARAPLSPAPGEAARAAPGRRDDRIELLAIYGVGAALRAEVSINRRHWRYLAGRRQPSGQAPDARYQLDGIDAPCVHLRKGAVRHTACLGPAASLDSGAARATGEAP